MARRSFSFMLAWRYLSPRRAMLSMVTLVSVTGVLLGVMVLVAVMSVYNGLEREVKKRLLGYTPHIKLEFLGDVEGNRSIQNWQDISDELSKVPGVTSVSPFIQDFALVSAETGYRKPYLFNAVNTQDPAQVQGLEDMLDKKDFPGGSANMGLDRRIVVAAQLSRDLGVGIGDTLKFYSSKNIQEAESAYSVMDQKPMHERYHDELETALATLKKKFEKRDKGMVFIPIADWQHLLDLASRLEEDRRSRMPLREDEAKLLEQPLDLLGDEQVDQDNGRLLPAEVQKQALSMLEEFAAADTDKMDLKVQKNIRTLVLPQEAEIIGIFEPGKMAAVPDVFMPLNLAQQVSGLNDSVQAIAVRLDEAHTYDADRIADQLIMRPSLHNWTHRTWIKEFGTYAQMIGQQRVMMYIVLSLITVISAFSMMAVMFTVTLQKRREIGVMKALGAARGQIVRVFVYQGMILGFVGALFGCGGGLLFLRMIAPIQVALRHFGFDPFAQSFNGFDMLPYVVRTEEVVTIAVGAFILCSLAALAPAFSAARSDAAKSLRNL